MRGDKTHHHHTAFRTLTALCLLSVLSACDASGAFSIGDVFAPKQGGSDVAASTATSGTIGERDVEAPEIFSAKEPGLWDGRPSLGGVWVAHPDVTDPERVIIRNQSNGQSVVGALFRRERDIPGPRLQMSSDAAEALGVLAGAPVELTVTAFRKEVIPQTSDDTQSAGTGGITQTSLDPITAASAAIETAEPTNSKQTPATSTNRPQSTLVKPFVQIGIFSQEANAERVAKQIRGAGVSPTIKAQEAGGKPFWRVIAGPANTTSEQKKLLDTIKGEGFSDAYAVTN